MGDGDVGVEGRKRCTIVAVVSMAISGCSRTGIDTGVGDMESV